VIGFYTLLATSVLALFVLVLVLGSRVIRLRPDFFDYEHDYEHRCTEHEQD